MGLVVDEAPTIVIYEDLVSSIVLLNPTARQDAPGDSRIVKILALLDTAFLSDLSEKIDAEYTKLLHWTGEKLHGQKNWMDKYPNAMRNLHDAIQYNWVLINRRGSWSKQSETRLPVAKNGEFRWMDFSAIQIPPAFESMPLVLYDTTKTTGKKRSSRLNMAAPLTANIGGGFQVGMMITMVAFLALFGAVLAFYRKEIMKKLGR